MLPPGGVPLIWYEYVLRGIVLASSLLVVTRFAGQRFVGGISPVDLVVAISVGTIAGSATIMKSIPLWAGIVSLLTWGAFEWAYFWLTSRSRTVEGVLVGGPTVRPQDGTISMPGLRSAMISPQTLCSMLREHGVVELSEVERVTIEPSGKLGIERARRRASLQASGTR